MKPPAPPAWLDEAARAEWDRMTKAGCIVPTDANLMLLAAYCQAFARWRQAEQVLNETGTEIVLRDDKGNVKSITPSPQIGISAKYFDRMVKAALQLGLGGDKADPKSKAGGAAKSSGFFAGFPGLH